MKTLTDELLDEQNTGPQSADIFHDDNAELKNSYDSSRDVEPVSQDKQVDHEATPNNESAATSHSEMFRKNLDTEFYKELYAKPEDLPAELRDAYKTKHVTTNINENSGYLVRDPETGQLDLLIMLNGKITTVAEAMSGQVGKTLKESIKESGQQKFEQLVSAKVYESAAEDITGHRLALEQAAGPERRGVWLSKNAQSEYVTMVIYLRLDDNRIVSSSENIILKEQKGSEYDDSENMAADSSGNFAEMLAEQLHTQQNAPELFHKIPDVKTKDYNASPITVSFLNKKTAKKPAEIDFENSDVPKSVDNPLFAGISNAKEHSLHKPGLLEPAFKQAFEPALEPGSEYAHELTYEFAPDTAPEPAPKSATEPLRVLLKEQTGISLVTEMPGLENNFAAEEASYEAKAPHESENPQLKPEPKPITFVRIAANAKPLKIIRSADAAITIKPPQRPAEVLPKILKMNKPDAQEAQGAQVAPKLEQSPALQKFPDNSAIEVRAVRTEVTAATTARAEMTAPDKIAAIKTSDTIVSILSALRQQKQASDVLKPQNPEKSQNQQERQITNSHARVEIQIAPRAVNVERKIIFKDKEDAAVQPALVKKESVKQEPQIIQQFEIQAKTETQTVAQELRSQTEPVRQRERIVQQANSPEISAQTKGSEIRRNTEPAPETRAFQPFRVSPRAAQNQPNNANTQRAPLIPNSAAITLRAA